MNAGAVRSVRRNMRNVVHNYTDAQVKVREATSNDPWGPSSTLMSQIAEYSHNMVAFTDIMQMIWRRLNDHGKNWRHVYKALVLMDYLIKAGNERVAQQCKENIFAIETLKDFQHFEDNTDHGRAIRERAKQLVSLLQDDERLKQERQRALKARERFLESNQGYGASDSAGSPVSPSERSVDHAHRPATDMEMARPQTSGEEELQLQLAIAMSQEEAEREKQRNRSDELRLQMAITESQSEAERANIQTKDDQQSAMTDLLSLDLGGAAAPAPAANFGGGLTRGGAGGVTADPWGMPTPAAAAPASQQAPAAPVDPWGMPVQQPAAAAKNDPWEGASTAPAVPTDPWAALDRPAPAAAAAVPAAAAPAAAPTPVDPWAPMGATSTPNTNNVGAVNDPWAPKPCASAASPTAALEEDEFAELTLRNAASGAERTGTGAASPWDMSGLGATLTPTTAPAAAAAPAAPGALQTGKPTSRSPHHFLGENSSLVNLDNLIGAPSGGPSAGPALGSQGNPFGWSQPSAVAANPFQAAAPPPPSINQIRNNRFEQSPVPSASTNPWNSPASAANPFLS